MVCNDEVKYEDFQYRLRAGAPMPTEIQGRFVLHTFMAEKSQVDFYAYTTSVVGSSQFRGQGGNYMSANYSRLLDESGDVFSGKVVHNPDFVDEDDI